LFFISTYTDVIVQVVADGKVDPVGLCRHGGAVSRGVDNPQLISRADAT